MTYMSPMFRVLRALATDRTYVMIAEAAGTVLPEDTRERIINEMEKRNEGIEFWVFKL